MNTALPVRCFARHGGHSHRRSPAAATHPLRSSGRHSTWYAWQHPGRVHRAERAIAESGWTGSAHALQQRGAAAAGLVAVLFAAGPSLLDVAFAAAAVGFAAAPRRPLVDPSLATAPAAELLPASTPTVVAARAIQCSAYACSLLWRRWHHFELVSGERPKSAKFTSGLGARAFCGRDARGEEAPVASLRALDGGRPRATGLPSLGMPTGPCRLPAGI
jgi:hypothetical protein